MRERLQKLISGAGFCSRRAAEELIAAGRVFVNGAPASLGDSADPELDTVEVDGVRLSAPAERMYIMLNKPRGYVTTLSDEKGRRTVAQLVAGAGRRLYPVGRLDLMSEGPPHPYRRRRGGERAHAPRARGREGLYRHRARPGERGAARGHVRPARHRGQANTPPAHKPPAPGRGERAAAFRHPRGPQPRGAPHMRPRGARGNAASSASPRASCASGTCARAAGGTSRRRSSNIYAA